MPLKKSSAPRKFPEHTAVLREVAPGEFVIVSFNRISLGRGAINFEPTLLRTKQVLTLKPDKRKEPDPLSELEKLHDIISDTIEGGRLRESDIPDDYEALVLQLEKTANSFEEIRSKMRGFTRQ